MAAGFPPSRWFLGAALLIGLISILSAHLARSSSATTPLWRDIRETSIVAQSDRLIVPTAYRTLALDLEALRTILAAAPMEGSTAMQVAQPRLALPAPDGSFIEFRLSEAPIMEPALAAKFPEIKTYLGYGVNDTSVSVRFDLTPHGFHALILNHHQQIYIDPYARDDQHHYISYYADDFKPSTKKLAARMAEGPVPPPIRPAPHTTNTQRMNGTRRTYRLAVGATGEYTQFHGGTKPLALAAIATTINRVTGVYEREVGVRLVLVASNDQVVYTDPDTDGYTNDDAGALLSENQDKLDSIIGSDNYDVGHVFGTVGGGAAQLAVICQEMFKAQGQTGLPAPVGDPFDIDYVAHELGHQFGASHTFNGTTSACGFESRDPNAAYEPGSGSTIMSYAGICGAENLQSRSDAYFHTKTYDDIMAHINDPGGGDRCGSKTTTGNTTPTVSAGASHTIPRQTPFTLTGLGADADGDSLTYAWEQFNLGEASPPNTDDGSRPLFRSFPPAGRPDRTFPQINDILNTTTTLGESLPTTNRTLTFRLTVRDNRGGVNNASVAILVTTSAGPFRVTGPNTAVVWAAQSTQRVTWDVAGTTAAPVSCPNVDILLSVNGGMAFDTILADNTPNDGSQVIVAPTSNTAAARLKIACANNIFFDIGDSDFAITAGTAQKVYLPQILR